MKRSLLSLSALALLFPAYLCAHASENATVTEDDMPLMKAPSFISEEVGSLMKNERVEALSRTSFTDYLAAIPDDYWYLVRTSHGGATLTGYLHGSVLVLDPGVLVPVADPPGFAPKAPAPAAKRYTVRSSIDDGCMKTCGTLKIPEDRKAKYFEIARFDSSFTPCPSGGIASIIGFSIAPESDPGNAFFSYEEHIASDTAEIEAERNELNYLVLDPGTYTLYVTGGPQTILEISYELADIQ